MKHIYQFIILLIYSASASGMHMPSHLSSTSVVKLWALPFIERSIRPGYVYDISHSLQQVVERGTYAHLNQSLSERTDIAAIINTQDAQGNTALHKAAQENDWPKGSLLLQHGAKASIELRNALELTPYECLFDDDPLNAADPFRFECCPMNVFGYIMEAVSQNKTYEIEEKNVPPISNFLKKRARSQAADDDEEEDDDDFVADDDDADDDDDIPYDE